MLSGLSRLLFVVDDTSRSAGSPGGGSRDGGIRPRCRIMEPAPPTYEEALTFFVRDGNSNGNGGGSRSGQLAIAEVAANGSGGGGRRQSLSEDYEMAERLQQEEIERCRSLPGRERSASLAGLPYGAGGRTPTRGERWSVSSAPGDARSSAYRNFSLGQSLQSPRGRLRTIQEGKLHNKSGHLQSFLLQNTFFSAGCSIGVLRNTHTWNLAYRAHVAAWYITALLGSCLLTRGSARRSLPYRVRPFQSVQ